MVEVAADVRQPLGEAVEDHLVRLLTGLFDRVPGPLASGGLRLSLSCDHDVRPPGRHASPARMIPRWCRSLRAAGEIAGLLAVIRHHEGRPCRLFAAHAWGVTPGAGQVVQHSPTCSTDPARVPHDEEPG